jgi:hypothetical protein
MSEKVSKNVIPVTREQIRDAWREEIAGDVFELLMGVSRLMERVRGPDRRTLSSDHRARRTRT